MKLGAEGQENDGKGVGSDLRYNETSDRKQERK